MGKDRHLPFSIEREPLVVNRSGSPVEHGDIPVRLRKIRGDDREDRTSFLLQHLSWLGLACFVVGCSTFTISTLIAATSWLSDGGIFEAPEWFGQFQTPARRNQMLAIFLGGWFLVALSLVISVAQRRRVPLATLLMNAIYLAVLMIGGIGTLLVALRF